MRTMKRAAQLSLCLVAACGGDDAASGDGSVVPGLDPLQTSDGGADRSGGSSDGALSPMGPGTPMFPPQNDGAVPDSGSAPLVPGTGPAPTLPEVSGACPEFVNGTIDFMGLGGVNIQAGARGTGDGALVFYWHGTGSTAAEVNLLIPADVRREILDQGGILISPQTSTGEGSDCSGTSTFRQGDFAVADQIAACAVRDHNINPRRIYTTGCSAGGLHAACMAMLRSEYVAAAVPNSGGLVLFPPPSIDGPYTPAVMTMHGGASDVVLGYNFANGSRTLDTRIKDEGGFVVNCDHGGDHCRAPAELYRAGWQFMRDHPYGTSPSPYGSGLPASFPDYCAPF